ncbi:hypothetical protein [Brevundimonas sp. NIBR11]|uniref:hypothetical protein n=1 Tax=Brevundimonas sp. NIBR11 TaxID=3015999 RepID=UPI0022EFEF16|nr:hypothetical protein [Brevundimonas sp. NIBR11]WGM31661.1 hypothetical protein KKHFBJBL_01908 [Brevundimonas sp. NIBR11]
MRIVTRTALALTAVVALAACDRSQTPAAPTEPAAPATAPAADSGPSVGDSGLALEAEGLRLFDDTGAARAIPFGTPQATAIASLAASIGGAVPEVTTNAECGAGPVQSAKFSNGLQLLFQNDQFQGWFVDQAGMTTVDGMGVGSTRGSIEGSRTIEMQEDSTLGAEFDSGGVGGFLTDATPQGTVTGLYAGLTCFFR